MSFRKLIVESQDDFSENITTLNQKVKFKFSGYSEKRNEKKDCIAYLGMKPFRFF